MMKIKLNSLSAIPLKTYRNWGGRKLYKPKLYEKLFKFWTKKDKAYRIYLPVGKPAKPHNTQGRKSIEDYLQSVGYTIDDYLIGMAVHKDNGRTMKIGKILSKGKQVELKRVFDNDKSRQAQSNQDMYVVVSRHPYDIAGMSTGRDWESCLNIVSGSNRAYTQSDVEAGHLVAYLVEGSDKNINRPLARVRLLRYEADKGNSYILHRQVRVYGNSNPGFITTIDNWLAKINPKDAEGSYCLNENAATYTDGMRSTLTILDDDSNVEGLQSEVIFKTRGSALKYLETRWKEGSVTAAFGSPLLTDDDLLSVLDEPGTFDFEYKSYLQQLSRSPRVSSLAVPVWKFAERAGLGNLVIGNILGNTEIPPNSIETLLRNLDLNEFAQTANFSHLSPTVIDVMERIEPGLVWSSPNLSSHTFTNRHVPKMLEHFSERDYVDFFLRGTSVKLSVVKSIFAAYLEKPKKSRAVLGSMLSNSVFLTLPRAEQKALALNVAINYDMSIVVDALETDIPLLKEVSVEAYKATGLDYKAFLPIKKAHDMEWAISTFGVDMVARIIADSSDPFLEPDDTLRLLRETDVFNNTDIIVKLLSKQVPSRHSIYPRPKYQKLMTEAIATIDNVEVLNAAMSTQAEPNLRNLRLGDMFATYLQDHVENGSPINMDMTKASDNVIYEIVYEDESVDLIDPKQLAHILVRTSNNSMEDAAEQLMEVLVGSHILPDVVKSIYDINIPLGDATKEILEEGFMDKHPELEDLVRDI